MTTERTFEHARAVYDAMTPDSQQRVLDRFDEMLAMYYDEDVRKLFTQAVDIEFSTIERRMLLKKNRKARHEGASNRHASLLRWVLRTNERKFMSEVRKNVNASSRRTTMTELTNQSARRRSPR